jgi:anti-anti-sigma factor
MSATLELPHWPAEPAQPPFLLSIDVDAARITVRGELDRRHVHRLDEAVEVLVHTSAPGWSVDTSAVSFCDAEGLRGLARAQHKARSAGRAFVVERPSGCLQRLLRLVGIDEAEG